MSKSELKLRVIEEITRKTERDKQVRVGPSSVGNPCPKCLGRQLAGVPDDREFSLWPWLGTAMHSYLEKSTFEDALHEFRVDVGEIPGYGIIKGSVDLYLEGTVGDWKLIKMAKIKTFRIKGPPEVYRYQTQLYARGCELAGLPVDSVAIIFIPRDSGNVNDIYVHEEDYQPEMAEAALERAGRVFEIVQAKGWEGLPSDPDCWECNMNW